MDEHEFYRRRKYESRKRLFDSYFFRKFKAFVEWRIERGDFPN